MSTYGRSVYDKISHGIQVSADGMPLAKAGGITLEWGAVTAAASDYVVRPNGEIGSANFLSTDAFPDDFVYTGQKYLRWGQVVCRLNGGTSAGKFVPYGATSGLGGGTIMTSKGDMYILNHSVHEEDYNSDHPEAIDGGLLWKHRILYNFAKSQTITVNATGGTFTITYKGQTTSAQAFNDSAANVQADLEALSTIGAGKVTVTLASSVYTIVLSDDLGALEPFTTDPALLTGGTQSATVGTTSGSVYGPTPAQFDAAFPTVRFVQD